MKPQDTTSLRELMLLSLPIDHIILVDSKSQREFLTVEDLTEHYKILISKNQSEVASLAEIYIDLSGGIHLEMELEDPEIALNTLPLEVREQIPMQRGRVIDSITVRELIFTRLMLEIYRKHYFGENILSEQFIEEFSNTFSILTTYSEELLQMTSERRIIDHDRLETLLIGLSIEAVSSLPDYLYNQIATQFRLPPRPMGSENSS